MKITEDGIETNRVELTRSELKDIENELYNDGKIKNYSLWLFISHLVNEIDSKLIDNLNG